MMATHVRLKIFVNGTNFNTSIKKLLEMLNQSYVVIIFFKIYFIDYVITVVTFSPL